MTQQEFEHRAMQMRTKAVRVACQFGLPMEEAEDVAQDVMLRLWCMHEDIHPHDPTEVLAAMMSRRCCIDRWRLRKQEVEVDDTLSIIEESNQHDRLEYKELEEWLFRRIDQLPSTCGIILKMRQLEHRELDEIATLLGISKSSVSTLLSRARHQLLEQLKRRNKE
ncbi:MAG: sigma-70 family RNA polymerase sigma factor [Bacteroidaceae bacterium]|nr:sigma-70 family RNA polymerase sigma factor [Bacteroidaceae bacterium]